MTSIQSNRVNYSVQGLNNKVNIQNPVSFGAGSMTRVFTTLEKHINPAVKSHVDELISDKMDNYLAGLIQHLTQQYKSKPGSVLKKELSRIIRGIFNDVESIGLPVKRKLEYITSSIETGILNGKRVAPEKLILEFLDNNTPVHAVLTKKRCGIFNTPKIIYNEINPETGESLVHKLIEAFPSLGKSYTKGEPGFILDGNWKRYGNALKEVEGFIRETDRSNQALQELKL